jgi:ABC-type cobalamin/Fe3+-siderophores transport system ATPase subunit
MIHALRHGNTPSDTAGDDVILAARGLRLGYGRRTVLDGVCLEIRRGQFWFLVGPNGQGKTTLLRGLLGRLKPQAGQLVARGDLACRERLGFVPQSCSLAPTLPTTVREFVSLGTVGTRMTRAEQQQGLAWALAKVGLAGMECREYWSLSGGQRQRALVARALVRRPSILIADEPTSGLDLSVEDALLQSLAELHRTEQLTLMVVTHDLAIAARYGTHLALVHDGGVEAGPVEQMLTAERLGRAYGVPIDVHRAASGLVHVTIGDAGRMSS